MNGEPSGDPSASHDQPSESVALTVSYLFHHNRKAIRNFRKAFDAACAAAGLQGILPPIFVDLLSAISFDLVSKSLSR
jgi:hypothetical protein